MGKLNDDELLAWQARHVQAAQDSRMHGRVITHVEGGKITRVQIEQSHKPPPPPKEMRQG